MGKNITNKKSEDQNKQVNIKATDNMIYYIRVPHYYICNGSKLKNYALSMRDYGDGNVVWFTNGDVEINSQSETELTKALGCKKGIVNTEMIVVEFNIDDREKPDGTLIRLSEETKEVHRQSFKQVLKNGFDWRDEHYIFFGAGAGQMRTKRSVFVKESAYLPIDEKIMCGITLETINTPTGYKDGKPKYMCSPTRFLAYKSLQNSNTSPWDGFDIDKAIVVDDWEGTIQYDAQFIDCRDFNSYCAGNTGVTDIDIPYTDGWGMMLPGLHDKQAFSFRAPWFKGLITEFDFVRFIKMFNANSAVKDLWGDEHDVIKEDIHYIFTASQFKLWKAYKNWDDYKYHFKRLGCCFGVCVEEIETDKKSEINYQMLQTLNFTHDEVKKLIERDTNVVKNWLENKDAALKLVGVDCETDEWENANYWVKMIDLCPELINTPIIINQIRDIASNRIWKIKGGRITTGGQYHFIAPDAFAFSEWLFLGEENPTGLIPEGWCFNKHYKQGEMLDMLRAPHLYREHCLRRNAEGEMFNECLDWFGSCSAVYTSIHDDSTKVLNNDVDGDKALVLPESDIITQRAMKDMVGIHSLKYEIRSGEKCEVTIDNIIDSMFTTYGDIANIGKPSNHITKIWDSDLPEEEKLKLVAFKVQVVNNRIDYAKSSDYTFCQMCDEAEEITEPIIKGEYPCYFWLINKAEKDSCKQEPQTEDEATTPMQKIVYQVNQKFKKSPVKLVPKQSKRGTQLKYGSRLFECAWLMEDYSDEVADGISYYGDKIYNKYISYSQSTSKNKRIKDRINFGVLSLPQSTIDIKYGGKIREIKEQLINCVPMNYSDEDRETIVYNVLTKRMFGDKYGKTRSAGRIAIYILCFGDRAYMNLCANYGQAMNKKAEDGVFVCSDGTAYDTVEDAAAHASCEPAEVYRTCQGVRDSIHLEDGRTISFTQTRRADHKPHKGKAVVCDQTGELFENKKLAGEWLGVSDIAITNAIKRGSKVKKQYTFHLIETT